MPKRRHNPVNWERQAHYHETEGSRVIVFDRRKRQHILSLNVVTQDLKRRNIVDTLCSELRAAGFRSAHFRIDRTDARCDMWRVKEQECYLNRILPHVMSHETKREIQAALTHLTRPKAPIYREPEPFTCPQ